MNTKTYIFPAVQKKIRKTKICIYHLNGKCIRASNCQFAHSEEELKNPPNLYKTRLCMEYSLKNTCPQESQCGFAHGQEELRWTEDLYKTLPCPYYKKNDLTSCFLGTTCRWAHGEEELRTRTNGTGHTLSREHEKRKKKSKVGTTSKDFLTPPTTNTMSNMDPKTRKFCDYDADFDYAAGNAKCEKKQSDSVISQITMSPSHSFNQDSTYRKQIKVGLKSSKHENILNSAKKKINHSSNKGRKTTNRFNQCPQYFKETNILNSPIQRNGSGYGKVPLENTKSCCEKSCYHRSVSFKYKSHSLYKTFNQSVQTCSPRLSYGNQETLPYLQQPHSFLKKANRFDETTTNATTTDRSKNSQLSNTILNTQETSQNTNEDDFDLSFSLNHPPNRSPPYYMYRSSSLTTLQDHLSMQGVFESPSVLTIPHYQRSSTQSSMLLYDNTKNSDSLKSYDDTNVPYNCLQDPSNMTKPYNGTFSHRRNIFQKMTFHSTESPKRLLVTSQSDLPLCQQEFEEMEDLSNLYSNSLTCDMNRYAASQEFCCSISTAYVSCHLDEEKCVQETYTSPA